MPRPKGPPKTGGRKKGLNDELGRADTATLAKLFASLSVSTELPSAVDRAGRTAACLFMCLLDLRSTGTSGLLARPPLLRCTLEVSKPEATTTAGRRLLGRQRHENGLTVECGD
jgi:hypothetical protein